MTFPREPIQDVCEDVVVGHVGPSSGHRMEGGIPFLMGKNVGEGFLKLDDLERVSPDFHRAQKKSQLRPGDVVVVRIGESGQAAKIPETLGEANCSGLVVLKQPGRVTADFLVHFLNSPEGRRQSIAESKGSTRQTLNTRSIASAKIPVPTLTEQRRIADVLDRTRVLRTKRRTSLAELSALSHSIFLTMFGDPATNPQGWPKASLDELFQIARGGSPRPIDDFLTDSPDGINWIMIGDAAEGAKYITGTRKRIKPEGARRSRFVKPGDFLLTNSMSFGRPYILKTSGCIHDGWLVLSPRQANVDSNYFYSLLSSTAVYAEFARRAPGVTVKNLNIDLVRGVMVPIPPISIQREFSTIAAVIERSAIPFNDSLDRIDDLFASLQQRAFRGEL